MRERKERKEGRKEQKEGGREEGGRKGGWLP